MVVNTGADAYFIDHNLAYTIGINPVAGGAMGTVQDLSAEQPTASTPSSSTCRNSILAFGSKSSLLDFRMRAGTDCSGIGVFSTGSDV